MAEADVFISYSRRDQKRVLDFAERLRAAGVSVWIDQGGIEAATKWSQSIVQAIEACQVFLLVASETSFASENVVKEVSLASESGKHILPVYLEPLTPPASMRYQLAGIQHVELFGKNEERAYESILGSLERLVADGRQKLARGGQSAAQRRKKRFAAAGALVAVVAAAGFGTRQYVKGSPSPPSIRLHAPAGVALEGARVELRQKATDGGDGQLIGERDLAADASDAIVFAATGGAEAVEGALSIPPGSPLQARLLGASGELRARADFRFDGEPGALDVTLDDSPAILLRLPTKWMFDSDEAYLELRRGEEMLVSCPTGGAAAVLFGPSTAGIAAAREGWGGREIEKADEADPGYAETVLGAWSRPLVVPLDHPLRAGDELAATLKTPGSTVLCRAALSVTPEVFQDHLME